MLLRRKEPANSTKVQIETRKGATKSHLGRRSDHLGNTQTKTILRQYLPRGASKKRGEKQETVASDLSKSSISQGKWGGEDRYESWVYTRAQIVTASHRAD